jgi:hypothetical protein
MKGWTIDNYPRMPAPSASMAAVIAESMVGLSPRWRFRFA